jgi:hypothetical protein
VVFFCTPRGATEQPAPYLKPLSAGWAPSLSKGHGGFGMAKSELVQKLAEANPHLYQRDVEGIVNVIFNEVAAALARGERVELRGSARFR